MGKRKRPGRKPDPPRDNAPPEGVAAATGPRKISVLLAPEERLLLARCQRILSTPEGERFPTVSETVRAALYALADRMGWPAKKKETDDGE